MNDLGKRLSAKEMDILLDRLSMGDNISESIERDVEEEAESLYCLIKDTRRLPPHLTESSKEILLNAIECSTVCDMYGQANRRVVFSLVDKMVAAGIDDHIYIPNYGRRPCPFGCS